jgi:hypothetical protein
LIDICGKEPEDEHQFNRANLFSLLTAIATIVLLLFTFLQVHDVKETNSADFALKLKSEIFTPDNARIISLLDDTLLKFHPFGKDDGWFELNTINRQPYLVIDGAPTHYTLVQIDLMLMAFENLSFYEKKSQIDIDYIYEQYAYYITAIWKNPDIQNYILMTRSQPQLRTSYGNFERLYRIMANRLSKDSADAKKALSPD